MQNLIVIQVSLAGAHLNRLEYVTIIYMVVALQTTTRDTSQMQELAELGKACHFWKPEEELKVRRRQSAIAWIPLDWQANLSVDW